MTAGNCFITMDMLAVSHNEKNDIDHRMEFSLRAEGVRRKCVQGMGMGGWAVAGMTPSATPERRSLRTPRREWLHRRLRLRPGTRTFLLSNVPVPPTTPASWNAAAINPAERDRKSTMMLWAAATTHRFRKPRIEANAAIHVFGRQICENMHNCIYSSPENTFPSTPHGGRYKCRFVYQRCHRHCRRGLYYQNHPMSRPMPFGRERHISRFPPMASR